MWLQNVRLRRTLLYALAFAGLQAVIVTAASFAQLSVVARSLDDRLVRSADTVVRSLGGGSEEWSLADLERALGRAPDLLYVEVVAADNGRTVASDSRLAAALPALARPLPEELRLGNVGISPLDDDTPDRVREAVLPLDANHALRALSRTTASTIVLDRLADRLWIVLPASFVAAAVVAWLLLRSTLSPLRRVSETVQRLGPKHLRRGRTRLEEIEADIEADEEVVRLQAALSAAIERIEEGYRAQSQFVANVAHELKTPIAVMLTEAQGLRGESATTAALRAFRASIEEEARRLGRLVESFLVVARAARGGDLTRHDTVFLPEIVVDAVQHVSHQADEHRVDVRPLLPAPDEAAGLEIDGDADLLGSMLENLIRNAVKHSPEGGQVDVALSVAPGRARIEVRDRGPGVPPEIAARVFERHVRGVPTDGSGRGGFGLGLAIAANVARLHGGDIGVENHPGGGAVFHVTLPLDAGDSSPVSAGG